MEKEYFELCNTRIELLWEEPHVLCGSTEKFRCAAGTPDISIRIHKVDRLPEPSVDAIKIGEHLIWQRDGTVYRGRRDPFRLTTHAVTSYCEGVPHLVQTYIRKEDWTWAAGDRYLWQSIGLQQLLLYQKSLLCHASYIEVQGGAILFTAASGVGKSTQAELWRKHRGAAVINGDKAGISLKGDTVIACGVPFSGTSGICENRSLPLKAVVVLSQGKDNVVRRLSAVEAIAAVCPNVFADQGVPLEWALARELLLELVSRVPLYSLCCTPDIRSVEALEQVME